MSSVIPVNYKDVEQKIHINEMIILLYSIDESRLPPKSGNQNLFAINKNEELLWIADLPDDYPYAYYNEIKYMDNILYAWCGSIKCEINIETGKIINSKLVK